MLITMDGKRLLLLLLLQAGLLLLLIYARPGLFCRHDDHDGRQAPPVTLECREKPTSADLERERVLTALSGPDILHDDPRLVSAIDKYMIDRPRPLMAKFSYRLYETPQAKAAMTILNKKRGFFVECGGLDGERSSNTIVLENSHGWTGLLVEMDPSFYMQLRGKNRKAYSTNSCLSPHTYPTVMEFREHAMGEGRLVSGGGGSQDVAVHKTFCFPLYSLLLALNNTKVDFFSLDVEGMELPILKTIPWDKVDISVLAVEYVHGKGGAKAYEDYMRSVGYRVHSRIKFSKPEIYLGVNDLIFVKDSL